MKILDFYSYDAGGGGEERAGADIRLSTMRLALFLVLFVAAVYARCDCKQTLANGLCSTVTDVSQNFQACGTDPTALPRQCYAGDCVANQCWMETTTRIADFPKSREDLVLHPVYVPAPTGMPCLHGAGFCLSGTCLTIDEAIVSYMPDFGGRGLRYSTSCLDHIHEWITGDGTVIPKAVQEWCADQMGPLGKGAMTSNVPSHLGRALGADICTAVMASDSEYEKHDEFITLHQDGVACAEGMGECFGHWCWEVTRPRRPICKRPRHDAWELRIMLCTDDRSSMPEEGQTFPARGEPSWFSEIF